MSIFLFVGPSGSGKTTLSKICEEYGFPELVSTTTRDKRIGEIDGVNYNFISDEAFDSMQFVESSNYAGKKYGITVEELEDKLNNFSSVYAVVDIVGMQKFKLLYDNTVAVFVDVKPETMVERMRIRKDSEQNIAKRLKHCQDNNEFENAKHCDYTVTNEDLLFAQNQVRCIVEKHII